MRIGRGLLAQLEQCGLSAKLAQEHAEASADISGSRLVKIEIARAYHAKDQAQVQEAHTALRWLTSEPGHIVTLGEEVDLSDKDTGEVLVTGRPGAILEEPGLVIAWMMGEQFDGVEPDDDIGLIAMGLAKLWGRPFRVAHVVLNGDDVFPRRSAEIAPARHPALLERIRAAASRPRIACPGDWCGACRVNVHCDSWRARTSYALTVFKIFNEGTAELEITNENASELALRIKAVEKAAELASKQLKAFVRNGGRCVVNGKAYTPGQCSGKLSVDVKQLEADGLTQYIKQGAPYETWTWKRTR